MGGGDHIYIYMPIMVTLNPKPCFKFLNSSLEKRLCQAADKVATHELQEFIDSLTPWARNSTGSYQQS